MKARLKKVFQKAKSIVKKSGGFLTAKGKFLDYTEWHSFGAGVLDGYMNPSDDYIGRLDVVRKENSDVDNEPHYFQLGFPIGRNLFLVLGFLVLAFSGLVAVYFLKQP